MTRRRDCHEQYALAAGPSNPHPVALAVRQRHAESRGYGHRPEKSAWYSCRWGTGRSWTGQRRGVLRCRCITQRASGNLACNLACRCQAVGSGASDRWRSGRVPFRGRAPVDRRRRSGKMRPRGLIKNFAPSGHGDAQVIGHGFICMLRRATSGCGRQIDSGLRSSLRALRRSCGCCCHMVAPG